MQTRHHFAQYCLSALEDEMKYLNNVMFDDEYRFFIAWCEQAEGPRLWSRTLRISI